MRIYRIVVRPVLNYAAETKADTAKTKNTLTTTEMTLRSIIVGVTLRDNKRDSDIRVESDYMSD